MTPAPPPRSPGGPALRADAQRNRRCIVAAAREAFAEADLDVPMEGIAHRAGVGIGRPRATTAAGAEGGGRRGLPSTFPHQVRRLARRARRTDRGRRATSVTPAASNKWRHATTYLLRCK